MFWMTYFMNFGGKAAFGRLQSRTDNNIIRHIQYMGSDA